MHGGVWMVAAVTFIEELLPVPHIPHSPLSRPACPVAQIGRAGRDGSEAQCVALVDDADFVRLRSLAFSSVLDLAAVRAFLQAVFSPAAEGQRVRRSKAAAKPAGGRGRKRKAAAPAAPATMADEEDSQPAEQAAQQQQQQQQQQQRDRSSSQAAPAPARRQDSHNTAGAPAGQESDNDADAVLAGAAAAASLRRFGVLAVRQLAAELDMREDSMEAVLSYLEADDAPCLRMLPTTALSVKVSFYAAAPEALAPQYPVVQVRASGGGCADHQQDWFGSNMVVQQVARPSLSFVYIPACFCCLPLIHKPTLPYSAGGAGGVPQPSQRTVQRSCRTPGSRSTDGPWPGVAGAA